MIRRSENEPSAGRAGPVASVLSVLSVVLSAMPVTAQDTTNPPQAEENRPAALLLRMPPEFDYGAICKPATAGATLSRDWTQWNGTLAPAEVPVAVADAQLYASGSTDTPRDRRLARKLLEGIVALEQRNATPEIKYALGELLLDPEAGPTDPGRAGQLLREALAAQEFRAALPLSRLLASGQLGDPDPKAAASVLATAAGLGDARAAIALAKLYADGSIDETFSGAAEHFENLALISARTAVATGDCTVLRSVGDFLAGKAGTQEDAVAAASWYRAGREAGDPDATKRLADLYANGRAGEQNIAQARALWLEAAQAGSLTAAVAAAEAMLEAGLEADTAVSLLRQAAGKGEASAYRVLARHYRGDYGTPPDFERMHQVLSDALRAPGASAAIYVASARAAATGQGIEPDPKSAAELYAAAAATGAPDGMREFGRYLLTEGKDPPRGVALIRRAAEAGDASAMHELAGILLCVPGLGTPREARSWDERAAAAGSTAAMRQFADDAAGDRGLGEPGLAARQKRFLERAAADGDRQAMVELAVGLADVPGGDMSAEMARWLEMAAAPGEGSTGGRLALARAMLDGDLPGGRERAVELLSGLDPMQDPAVEVELARMALEDAMPGQPQWKKALTRLSAAARAGRSDAMFMLAKLGDEVESVTGRSAREWHILAAKQGQAEALSLLEKDDEALAEVLDALERQLICDPEVFIETARLLRIRGGAGDAAKAEQALTQAEILATTDAGGLYDVAEAYLSGRATGAASPAKAIPLLERAARQGHVKAAVALGETLAEAGEDDRFAAGVDWLGRVAMTGEPSAVKALSGLARRNAGSRQAVEEILETLEAAGRRGVTPALTAYGTILMTADEAGRDRGVEAITTAADRGDVEAMKVLARLHASGIGGEVSADESTRWIRAAAEKGDPEAMYRYALALDLGFGVEADHESAAVWHKRARELGYGR